MQNKRFLGLGFTFAAQDSGLEKKLVRIASLFERINKSAQNIKGIDIGIGSAKSAGPARPASYGQPGSRQSGRRSSGSNALAVRINKKNMPGEDKRKTSSVYFDKAFFNMSIFEKISGINAGSTEKEKKYTGYPYGNGKERAKTSRPKKSDANYEKLKNIADAYASALGKDVGTIYNKEMDRIIKAGIARGRTEESILKDLTYNANELAKTSDFLGAKFKPIKRTFEFLYQWAGKIGNSLEHFFDTIGLNLREILPKEFTAAFGVLQSLLFPIGKGLKALFSFGSGKINESIKGAAAARVGKVTSSLAGGASGKVVDATKKVSDEVDKANHNISQNIASMASNAIGNVKSLPTVQRLLFMMLNEGKAGSDGSKDSGGNKLLNFLESIPLIGFLIGLGKKIFGLIEEFTGLESIGTAFADVWASVTAAFSSVASWIGNILKPFEGLYETVIELIVPVIALSGALTGFVSEVWAQKDKFIAFFEAIGGLLSSYGKLIGAQIMSVIQPFVDKASPVINFITDVLTGFGKVLFQVYQYLGGMIGKGAAILADWATDKVKSATASIDAETARVQSDTDSAHRQNLSANVGASAALSDDEIKSISDGISKGIETLPDKVSQAIDNLLASKPQQVELSIKEKPNWLNLANKKNEILDSAAQGTAAGNM